MRVAAIGTLAAAFLLPFVGIGKVVGFTGWDLLQDENLRLEMRLLLGLAILGVGLTLFMRNPTYCLICGLVSLASFIGFAVWLRYGNLTTSINPGSPFAPLLETLPPEQKETIATMGRFIFSLHLGFVGAIVGLGFLLYNAFMWFREEQSIFR